MSFLVHYTLGWQRIETRPDDNSAYSAVYVYGLRGGPDDIVLRSRDTTGAGVFDQTAFDLTDANFNDVMLVRERSTSGAGAGVRSGVR